MNTALLYRRVSTAKQDNSLAAQELMLTHYCEALGHTIAGTFEDNDTSGSIPMVQRTGGGQLLKKLEELAATCPAGTLHLICAKQDRLGRDTADQIATIRRIWNLGVTPHFVAEGGALPRTSQNELLFEIKASVAQHERNSIRERIRIGLDYKRQNNELTGTVPYGWDAVENGATTSKGVKVRELMDNFEEQKWILAMAQWRTAGWGYHRIGKELNRLNVPTKLGRAILNAKPQTPNSELPKWQSGNVAKVLNNKTVLAWLAEQSRMAA